MPEKTSFKCGGTVFDIASDSREVNTIWQEQDHGSELTEMKKQQLFPDRHQPGKRRH